MGRSGSWASCRARAAGAGSSSPASPPRASRSSCSSIRARTRATLSELGAPNPERLASVCRELTKLHEQIVPRVAGRARPANRLARRGHHRARPGRAGTSRAGPRRGCARPAHRRAPRRGASIRDVARELGAETGLGRRAVYARAQALRPSAVASGPLAPPAAAPRRASCAKTPGPCLRPYPKVSARHRTASPGSPS